LHVPLPAPEINSLLFENSRINIRPKPMDNQPAPLQPIVLNQPNQVNPIQKQKKSATKLLLGVVVILILVVVGLMSYFVLSQKSAKPTASVKKTASNSAETKKDLKIGYVTALEGLNLRQEPNTDSNKILLLPEGTEVSIIGTDGDWYYVETTTKGYVAKDYIASTKPEKTLLKTFKDADSPFNFLYPDVYKVTLKKIDELNLEYSFVSSDSYGGFKVVKELGLSTLGNYALKNYGGAKKTACAVQFSAARKECEQLETSDGTLYLLLIDNTLYKITYLKTEGGALADINNLVFYSLFFKES
jgi:hypothetical protein